MINKNNFILESQEKIKKAQEILKILNKKGFEAFIVGGAVRDFYLNIPFEDVDITTNASIQEIQNFFSYSKKSLNIKYGSIKICFKKNYFDITSYRKEGPYLDYRHPSYVVFISDIKEDIKRRDFTINSLLMDNLGNLIDYYNGYQDLKKREIKVIGETYLKLTEDVVRILRIFYLKARLNFSISLDIEKFLQENIFLLDKIKYERIIKELKKIFNQKYIQEFLIFLKETNAIFFFKKFSNYFPILSEI
ncbi:CCA tRNA nucleotidyltransferase [Candidatus Phytoplasma oryzae]|nr:CCA tRNA nucleotidyltransferase [Candidatus Phytoplasma oryzae]